MGFLQGMRIRLGGVAPMLERSGAASSSVAIGTASAFIVVAAMLSFVADPQDVGAGPRLRGTMASGDNAAAPKRLPVAPKRA